MLLLAQASNTSSDITRRFFGKAMERWRERVCGRATEDDCAQGPGQEPSRGAHRPSACRWSL